MHHTPCPCPHSWPSACPCLRLRPRASTAAVDAQACLADAAACLSRGDPDRPILPEEMLELANGHVLTDCPLTSLEARRAFAS